ncbi:MAG: hypothetical protein HY541_01540 [Deltaproteobacteria bacterium]|nr:hypothetical protein [Deltaproteobacteria bacterium]
MSLSNVSNGNRLRWDGKKSPFYEVYYLKITDAEKGWSFWARYTLLSPKKEMGKADAAIWGIFSRLSGQARLGNPATVALKQIHPLFRIDPFHSERFIQIQENFLSLDAAVGELADSDHEIRWDLRFEDPTLSTALYPYPFLYRFPFPKTKFLEPRLSTHVSGRLTVDRETISLNHHRAHQAHLWGSAYARRWVWGNCNQFSEDPSAVFEGVVAQIKLGPIPSPPLALFYFIVEGREYRANSIVQWIKNDSTHDLLTWQFSAECGEVKFAGTVSRDIAAIAGVEYQGPNGERRYCHSSMFADMRLEMYRRQNKEWILAKHLTARKTAAFETVEPRPDPRVKFVL